jgi:hypothetical protein
MNTTMAASAAAIVAQAGAAVAAPGVDDLGAAAGRPRRWHRGCRRPPR